MVLVPGRPRLAENQSLLRECCENGYTRRPAQGLGEAYYFLVCTSRED